MTTSPAQPRKSKTKTMQVVTISDQHGLRFAPGVPTVYLNCTGLIITPQIIGGDNCLTLIGCKNCRVTGGWLCNPLGPNDPKGHCLQLDQCTDIEVDGVVTSSVKPSGDKANVFASHRVKFSDCQFIGPNANDAGDIAASVCIDKGSSHVAIDGCQMIGPGPAGVSVAWGTDITITNNVIGSAEHPFAASGVQIGDCYPTKIKRVTVAGNRWFVDPGCPRVWAEPKRVLGLVVDGVKRA